MVKVYATLIINKRRSFAQVSDNFKEAVALYLKECGYDTNGDPFA